MATLKISLSDLPPDAVDVTDLSALPKAELMARLQDLYAFLGPDAEIAVDEGTVSITLPDPSGYQRAAAEREAAEAGLDPDQTASPAESADEPGDETGGGGTGSDSSAPKPAPPRKPVRKAVAPPPDGVQGGTSSKPIGRKRDQK